MTRNAYNLFKAFFLFSAPLTALFVAARFMDFDPPVTLPLSPVSPPADVKPRRNADPVRPNLLLPSTLASAVDSGAGETCRSCLNPDPSLSDDIGFRLGGTGEEALRVVVVGRPSLLVEVVNAGGVATAGVADEEEGRDGVLEDDAIGSSTTELEAADFSSPSVFDGVSNSSGLPLACTPVNNFAREQYVS